jgi:hypothetical protein
MDLARAILVKLEECEECTGLGWIEGLEIENHSSPEIAYHVMLLNEAGLIDAQDMTNSVDGLSWFPKRLTWAGHEFLEASKDEGIWQKAKGMAKEKTGGLSFAVLQAVLVKMATDAAVAAASLLP